MLGRLRIVALGIAAVVLVGLLVPATAQAETDKPTWRVGNYWVYKGNVLGLATASGDARMRFDVLGTESLTVGGTTYETFHLKVAVNTTAGSLTLNIPGDAWFRQSDLSMVKVKLVETIGGGPQPFVLTLTVTMTPPQEIRWPLSAGASWTVSGTVTGLLEITGQQPSSHVEAVSGTMSIGTTETVTVDAGKFDTTPVTFTMPNGNRSKSYWSSDAGNYVEQKSYNQSGAETSSSELTSYSYAKPSAAGFSGLGIFLGLDWLIWIAVFVIAIGAAVGAVGGRRRRRAQALHGPMPSMARPPESTMEPGPPREPPAPPP